MISAKAMEITLFMLTKKRLSNLLLKVFNKQVTELFGSLRISRNLYENFVDMEKLTAQEEEAMLAIWRTGEGNIKSFMESMSEAPPYTTIASTVKNLEKKGYLTSRLIGNAYLYKPAITEEEYKKRFMGTVVKEYFDNSYKELVNFFVEQKKLSAKELKEIINMIEGGK
jgi:BlaI family transcriptional regulator, penicillinase repressor